MASNNATDFANLPLKAVPSATDIVQVLDVSTGLVKQSTVGAVGSAGGGGSILLASATAANQAFVTMADIIPNTIDNILVVWSNVVAVTPSSLQVSLGYGGGPTFIGNAANSFGLWTDTTAALALIAASSAGCTNIMLSYNVSNTSAYHQSGNMDFTCLQSSNAINSQGVNIYQGDTNPLYMLTYFSQTGIPAPINSLQFSFVSGNILSGNFYVYGYQT